MRATSSHIDIETVPALVDLVEEVSKSNRPCLLRRRGEDVAALVPVHRRTHRRERTLQEEDDAIFWSAAGGWKGLVDAATLKGDLAASRGSDRPHVTL